MNEFNNKSHAQIEKKIKKRNYVPRGWRIRKIKEISEVLRGASPRPISDPKWFSSESNIGWVRISDVTKSKKILRKTEQYVSKEGMRKSRLVKKDNIIMSIAATVGKPIYTGFDVCIHDGFVVFNNLKVNKEYFYYLLESKEKQWGKYGQTGSQMNLNSSIVGNETVLIPDDELEQQKIAKILSTWDKAIELKEKLIEQKKELKKGLMQKLLTGEVRFPGFEDDWKEVKIKDIAEIYLGLTYTPQYVEEGVPFLSVKDLDGDKLNFHTVKYISREEYEKSTSNAKPKKGDILFGRVGTLGNPVILDENVEFCIFVSLGFLRIKNDHVSNYFVKYWMESNLFTRQVEAKVAGSSQKNLNTGWLKEFQLILPEYNEQKAIVNVLRNVDKEINMLEQEKNLLTQQKKGLMQLLLTGKVRVKV